MTSISAVEHDLVEDILAVKNALVEFWPDVLTNASQIEYFIRGGIEWLEETGHWSMIEEDLGNALKNLESELSPAPTAKLDQLLKTAKSDLEADINPILAEYDAIKDGEIGTIIETILNSLGTLDGIPAGLKAALAPMERILKTILGGGFSIALKDLPKHTSSSPVGSAGSGNDNATHQEGQDAVSNWFHEFEELVWAFEDPVNAIETDIESLLDSTALSAEIENLVTKLQQAVNKLEDELDITGAELDMDNIWARLEELLTEEDLFADIVTIATELHHTLAEGLHDLKELISELFTQTLDAESALAGLYQDITGATSPPSVLEVISIVISIPLTLVSEATGQQFKIPTSAFLAGPPPGQSGDHHSMTMTADGSMTDTMGAGSAMLVTDGVLQLTSYIIQIFDKAYSSEVTPSPTYKLVKGLIMSSISAIDLGLGYPAHHGFVTDPSKTGNLWWSKWVTVIATSYIQTLVDYRLLKDLKEIDELKTQSDRVDQLISSFKAFDNLYRPSLKKLQDAYQNLVYYIKQVYSEYPSRTSEFTKGLQNLDDLKTVTMGVNTDQDFTTKAYPQYKGFSVPLYIYDLKSNLTEAKKHLSGKSEILKRINLFITVHIDAQVYYNQKDILGAWNDLFNEVNRIKEVIGNNAKKDSKAKLMNLGFPAMGLCTQITNTTLSTVWAAEGSSPNAWAITSGILSMLGPISGNVSTMVFYERLNPTDPLSTEQKEHIEAQKKTVGNIIFAFSRMTQAYGILKNFVTAAEQTKIESATYSASGSNYTLTVTFNNAVSQYHTKASQNSCFVLNGTTATITGPTTAATSSSKTFTLTLSEALTIPATKGPTICVANDAFLDSNNNLLVPLSVAITQS